MYSSVLWCFYKCASVCMHAWVQVCTHVHVCVILYNITWISMIWYITVNAQGHVDCRFPSLIFQETFASRLASIFHWSLHAPVHFYVWTWFCLMLPSIVTSDGANVCVIGCSFCTESGELLTFFHPPARFWGSDVAYVGSQTLIPFHYHLDMYIYMLTTF